MYVSRNGKFMMQKPTLSDYLSGGKVNNFDLLRLVAALAVIFGHSFALSLNPAAQTEPVLELLKFGYSGSIAVDVFFMISGIFISQSLFFGGNYPGFLIKRFMRIWPGLTVCLALTVVLSLCLEHGNDASILGDPESYRYILRNSVLDIQWNIPDTFEGRHYTAANGSLWTLPLEVKMYCVVFVLGVFGILYEKYVLSTVSILIVMLLLLFPSYFMGFFNSSDKESLVPVLFFLAGMAIFAFRELVAIRPVHLLCILIVAHVSGPGFEVFSYFAIGMTALWFGCSDLISRLPRLPGDYSYGVYIYAWPVQQAIATIFPQFGPYRMFILASVIVLPLAIASWHWVELPAQILGKDIARMFKDHDNAVGRAPFWNRFSSTIRRNWIGLAIPVIVTIIAVVGFMSTTGHIKQMAAAPLDVEIVAFGPTPVVHAVPFNQQPNGQSAIWVKLNNPARQNFVLFLDDTPLTTIVEGDLLTAPVPAKLFETPGSRALFVQAVEGTQKLQSKPADFEVR
jgi:peptidoglycan/LPS O-acetylase OafA/YrhL